MISKLLLFLLFKTVVSDKIPIIYSPKYDISILGIEKFHPFDTKKYGKIYKYLIDNLKYTKEQFYTPEIVSNDDLLLVHSKKYLDSLSNSKAISQIAEISQLSYVPFFILKNNLLQPMKFATGGTILGIDLLEKYNWAINLSGGYHHAKATEGGGFCYFSDIAIAVKKYQQKHENGKILIIDLDAHQGNGYEDIFKDEKNIIVFDLYNKEIYPQDTSLEKYIDYKFAVQSGVQDDDYLKIITKNLPEILKKEKPDLIIYNAGTDIYKNDSLGKFKITKEGIIKRDEIIFKEAIKNNIKILMLLSGGYSKESYEITGKSIENLLLNVIKKE